MRRSGDTEAMTPAEDYPFGDRRPFDSQEFPKLHFIERRYAGDPTNWWVPNRACAEAMLRSSGFEITAHPEDEVYLCNPVDPPFGFGAAYPARARGA